MLGHKLYQVLSPVFEMTGTIRGSWQDIDRYDFFQPSQIVTNTGAQAISQVETAIKKTGPDVIINSIGIVKALEEQAGRLLNIWVNSLFPHQLYQICQSSGIRLIHISTDCVFSGRKGNYREDDPPDADDTYGKTKHLGELNGTEESTVIGSGMRTSCLNATLANGLMVRYLDYMDFYRMPGKPAQGGGHACEVIPPILALAERQHSSGKDVTVAIVLGYEIANRFRNFFATMEDTIEHKGWNPDCRGSFAMPLVAGKLLGLSPEQMENAVGISGSQNLVLGILDAPGEEYNMSKSLRMPRTAHVGILAAILASKGFTGPTRIIEGNSGFMEVVMRGNYDLGMLTENDGTFKIMHTGVKPFPCEGTNHGHIIATLNLVKKHDIKPEDVAHVTLKLTPRTAEHSGDPVKRHPYNKETADHSAYYMTAVAILDRAVGLDQFLPERINDTKVHELIDRVTVEATAELELPRDGGISEITTRQGQTYTCRIDIPKGHPLDPMTDKEIEEKFQGTASKYMSDGRMKQVMDTIYNLENLDGISELMKLMVFEC